MTAGADGGRVRDTVGVLSGTVTATAWAGGISGWELIGDPRYGGRETRPTPGRCRGELNLVPVRRGSCSEPRMTREHGWARAGRDGGQVQPGGEMSTYQQSGGPEGQPGYAQPQDPWAGGFEPGQASVPTD